MQKVEFEIATSEELASELKYLSPSNELLGKFKKHKPGDKYTTSILGRLLVAKMGNVSKKEIVGFFEESIASFYSKRHGFFWSISHKKQWVAAAVSNAPIGIDLEINNPRDEILFRQINIKDWKTFGEKNWDNFYKIWTAKEAALKLFSLDLHDIHAVQVVDRKGHQTMLKYRKQCAIAKTFFKDDLVVSTSQRSRGN